MKDIMKDGLGAPKIVNRSTFQAELDAPKAGRLDNFAEWDEALDTIIA